MTENYAFIGLGAMGFAMAANIRKKIPASSIMYVYDVYKPSCERFAAEFGTVGPIKILESPKEVAENAQVIVSMVPTAENVRQVYLDKVSGVVAAPSDPERVMLECSTIEAAASREVGEELKAAGAGRLIDSPVSGGVPAAEAATLSFMIGSAKPEDDLIGKRIQNAFGMIGEPKKFFWCGKPGAGLAAKISNNYISCTSLLVIAEAMAIGIRNGIDPKLLADVIHNSSGQSFMADHVNPAPGAVAHAPSSNNWKLGFKTQMMSKDIGLGIDAAKQVGIEPLMAEAAIELWNKAGKDPRCVDRDGSSVWLYINDIKE